MGFSLFILYSFFIINTKRKLEIKAITKRVIFTQVLEVDMNIKLIL